MMEQTQEGFKLHLMFDPAKAKLQILKLLNEQGPLTSDEVKEILVKPLYEKLPPTVSFLLLELSSDKLIESDMRKEGRKLVRQYYMKGVKPR